MGLSSDVCERGKRCSTSISTTLFLLFHKKTNKNGLIRKTIFITSILLLQYSQSIFYWSIKAAFILILLGSSGVSASEKVAIGETAGEPIWVLLWKEMIVIAVSQQLSLLGSVRRMRHKAKKTGGRQKGNSDRLHHCLEGKAWVFFSLHVDYMLSGWHITAISYQVLD